MPPESPQTETCLNKLEHLKIVFPVPVSNPYFVHRVSRFLDLVDDLKSSAPLKGGRGDYKAAPAGKTFGSP